MSAEKLSNRLSGTRFEVTPENRDYLHTACKQLNLLKLPQGTSNFSEEDVIKRKEKASKNLSIEPEKISQRKFAEVVMAEETR